MSMNSPRCTVCVAACFLLSVISWFATPSQAQVDGGRLPTRWDKDVSPTHPLPEYPRPQMVRKQWQNLNGPWQLGLTDSDATTPPATFDQKILVPFPYESALSGIAKASPTKQRLWYRRAFTVPASWRDDGGHVLLHFGAVNWDSAVSVNGKAMGDHKGGYDSFTYDITSALKPGDNTLTVSAWNPLRANVADAQVLGKQRPHSGGIFYTASTGIWQTVWIEPVPATYISSLTLVPDIDTNTLHVTVNTVGDTAVPVQITATDGPTTFATGLGDSGSEIDLPIVTQHLWSPDDPHLYNLHVALVGKENDHVNSYFAMRKISIGKDSKGVTRILLNNKFVFQVGALDQGFWPDGIYTAPTDAALKFDIQSTKQLGLNLLRKHAKVEPARWYYWTDHLGILVWQDMPQCFVGKNESLTDAAKKQWLVEWKGILTDLKNHPSIIVWTTFNADFRGP